MNLKHHKTLTEKKWSQFPFYKQIIMIANEINRAKSWIIKGDFEEVKNCYEKALELLDLSVAVLANKKVLREFLRFRELLAQEYINNKKNAEVNKKLFFVLLSLNKDSYNLLAK